MSDQLALDKRLVRRLRRAKVRIEVPDENSALFRGVPTDPRCFNKAATNLLVQRPQPGMPFVICVDDDLEYEGADRDLTRAFVAGPRQKGWRVLLAGDSVHGDFQATVDDALEALGAGGEEPKMPSPAPEVADGGAGLLAGFGLDLTRLVQEGEAEPALGRGEETQEVLSILLQWKAGLPIIAGPAGVGKTALLHDVAARLSELDPPLPIVAVDLGELFAGHLFDAERENLLRALIKEARERRVALALEHLELALLEAPHGFMLLSEALVAGARILGTTYPEFVDKIRTLPWTGRFQIFELSELGADQTRHILEEHRPAIARHHGVEIGEQTLNAVIERSLSLTGCLPGKAVKLLDLAAGRAALAGESRMAEIHVYLAAGGMQKAGPDRAERSKTTR